MMIYRIIMKNVVDSGYDDDIGNDDDDSDDDEDNDYVDDDPIDTVNENDVAGGFCYC